jgi:hypothetical protein
VHQGGELREHFVGGIVHHALGLGFLFTVATPTASAWTVTCWRLTKSLTGTNADEAATKAVIRCAKRSEPRSQELRGPVEAVRRVHQRVIADTAPAASHRLGN